MKYDHMLNPPESKQQLNSLSQINNEDYNNFIIERNYDASTSTSSDSKSKTPEKRTPQKNSKK